MSLESTLPVYFGNVCLRFLPVLDIVIHRFLEVPINTVNKTLEIILEHLGCLYKFHGNRISLFSHLSSRPVVISHHILSDRPITYLYHTLHFYERKLRDRPLLKKRLITAVTGALIEVRPENWALTTDYQLYIPQSETDSVLWIPDLSYYISLMRRLVDSMANR